MCSDRTARAYLVLEDSTVFSGFSVGAKGTTIGEVVFNTCTASYEEVLSDPTYYGQIVAQTYPLVGNRGIGAAGNIVANGYIVHEWCDAPSGVRGETLDAYLKRLGIIGISGVDTRSLTRKLRGKGYVKGAITDSLEEMNRLLEEIRRYSIRGAVAAVTVEKQEVLLAPNPRYKVAVIDYGSPRSLIEALLRRGCTVYRMPAGTTADELKRSAVQAVVFSDGPGDPDDNPSLIQNIREILPMNLPFIGIGLGHQMAALALGGKIEKMVRGHRGSNQPVKRIQDGRLFVTTQNHGYCVADKSLDPSLAEVSMVNVNDGSIEAVKLLQYPGETYQFTPVDSAELTGTGSIYDDFITRIEEA